MIVNLENREKMPLANKIKRQFQGLYIELISGFVNRRIFADSVKLKTFFQLKYPQLKVDSIGNTSCISCGLCEDICPTKAINIEKANMINFPNSLTTGESPLHFYLNVNDCVKCGLCQDVCYVDALELTENYSLKKVDLVSKN
ncbi:MAG: formate hydrogenlyase subunit 6/NADH:ubiquinone oxidoreductase subunit I [Bacteriovoracaceae bacterium]|jgi:formate hydrogenlyase subunit 6/NADH:ubiquinone oxidoreductase subunit I